MKFTLLRDVANPIFQQMLKTCNVKAKDTFDAEFLFRYDGKNLSIFSMNNFAEQTRLVPTEDISGDPDTSFTVTGIQFVEFWRQYSADEAICEYKEEEGVFIVSSPTEKTKFEFPCGDIDQYAPIQAVFAPSKSIRMDGDLLASALKSTSFCAATTAELAPLTAVQIKLFGQKLMAMATDKTRIAMITLDMDDEMEREVEMFIPHEVADILSALLHDEPEVTITPSERHIKLEWTDTQLITQIEVESAKYPKLPEVFERPIVAEAKVSRQDLIKTLKLASLIAKDGSVRVIMKDEHVTVAGFNKKTGHCRDSVTAQTMTGDGTMSVSTKNFMKGLETFGSAFVNLSIREYRANNYVLVISDDVYDHLLLAAIPSDDENDGDE